MTIAAEASQDKRQLFIGKAITGNHRKSFAKPVKNNFTLKSHINEGQSLRKLHKVKDNCSQQKLSLAITAKALRNQPRPQVKREKPWGRGCCETCKDNFSKSPFLSPTTHQLQRMWKITFLGLKLGQELKNRAAHPHQ